MVLTNTDASQITLKKQRKTLYAWKNDNDKSIKLGKSVLSEQPSYQSISVVNDRKLGGFLCGCTMKDTV